MKEFIEPVIEVLTVDTIDILTSSTVFGVKYSDDEVLEII